MSFRPLLICVFALPVMACSGAKEELGLTRRTPDEFAVVQRAPLEMPPDYYLRPPTPGAPRPQEQATVDQAQAAVLGRAPAKTPATKSSAEAVLLQKTNATAADPNIRNVIDAEADTVAQDKKPVIKRILDIGRSDVSTPASVVDAPAEAARIKANKQTGKPVNDGATAPIER